MFPFQQTGRISFGNNDEVGVDQTEDNVQDQVWMEYEAASAGVGGTNTSDNRPKGGRRQRRKSAPSSSTTTTTTNSNVEGDEQQRKIVHREVERQRRQEMSNLYGSLRSVLPPQYTKGKRSTSDHLGEAVNYIKDLEKNVKELGDKRNQLKASLESSSSTTSSRQKNAASTTPPSCPGTVVVLPRLGGLDIELNVAYEHEEYYLSTALQMILDEGIAIASYTSTKIDDRLVHNIVCEVSDIRSIDLDGLQQRLIFLVC